LVPARLAKMHILERACIHADVPACTQDESSSKNPNKKLGLDALHTDASPLQRLRQEMSTVAIPCDEDDEDEELANLRKMLDETTNTHNVQVFMIK